MEELFTLVRLVIEPEVSPIADEVHLALSFTIGRPVESVKWTASYIFDYTGKKKEVQVYESPAMETYAPEKTYTLEVTTPKIDIESIPRKSLLNVGLLSVQG